MANAAVPISVCHFFRITCWSWMIKYRLFNEQLKTVVILRAIAASESAVLDFLELFLYL